MNASSDPRPTPAPVPTAEQPLPSPSSPHPEEFWRPRPITPLAILLTVILASAALIAVLAAWKLPPFRTSVEATDNAYVHGHTTVIAPQVTGYVTAVLVRDYQQVRRGQILVQVDDSIYRARVAQAQANLDAQVARLAGSPKSRAGRPPAVTGSAARPAGPNIGKDDANRKALDAQVESARAALELAEIDLSHTRIVAPEDGQLGEISVQLGQFVTQGSQLFSLVPRDHWITAYFKEDQISRMAVGQKARFTVDAYDGARLTGYLADLSPATGSEFAVLKPDNATGNFVKVPQLIGVMIQIVPGQPFEDRLRPGMSVEVQVETRP